MSREMTMAPAVGFEPTTKRLTAARSTTELRRSEARNVVATTGDGARAGRVGEDSRSTPTSPPRTRGRGDRQPADRGSSTTTAVSPGRRTA